MIGSNHYKKLYKIGSDHYKVVQRNLKPQFLCQSVDHSTSIVIVSIFHEILNSNLLGSLLSVPRCALMLWSVLSSCTVAWAIPCNVNHSAVSICNVCTQYNTQYSI